MEVEGQSSHDVTDASGNTVDELSSIKREVEVPPGIYSVKFGNGNWTGLEVKAGEATEIKPGYLEVAPTGSAFVYVLETETGEVVEEILWSKPRVTLIPARFDAKFGNLTVARVRSAIQGRFPVTSPLVPRGKDQFRLLLHHFFHPRQVAVPGGHELLHKRQILSWPTTPFRRRQLLRRCIRLQRGFLSDRSCRSECGGRG
jgi:hypothetical protein